MNQCKFPVCLVEFICEVIWSWTLFVGRVLNYKFYFTSSNWSVQIIYFFLIQFFGAVKNCPFLLGCQLCWHIITHIILLWFFAFLWYQLRFSHFHFLFCLYGFSLFSLMSLTRCLSILAFQKKALLIFYICLNLYFIYFLSDLYYFLPFVHFRFCLFLF